MKSQKIIRKYNQKPWRRFHKPSCISGVIRRLCFAALVLETALVLKNVSSKNVSPAIACVEEKEIRQVLLTEAMESKSAPVNQLERYFGIRLRLKDGEIEFYHKEERRNFSDN